MLGTENTCFNHIAKAGSFFSFNCVILQIIFFNFIKDHIVWVFTGINIVVISVFLIFNWVKQNTFYFAPIQIFYCEFGCTVSLTNQLKDFERKR